MIPCPLHWLTGLNCPFCGGQRMAWAILQGEWVEAFHYNPFLFCLLPIIILFLLAYLPASPLRARLKFLLSDRALLFYLIIMLLWGIIRNIYGI